MSGENRDVAKNPFGSQEVALRLASGVQAGQGVETASTALAAQSKAMVESRYYMAIARPRNWDQVRQDILKECRRPSFARNKSTLYHKPIAKGVEGLGIRFTEMALRCMTNVLIETNMIFEDDLKEVHRVSVTDLEANVTYPLDIRVSKTVERSKPEDDGSYISARKNSYGKLTYTIPANDDDLLNKRGALISKAQRTLSLRIVPGDIQDEAEKVIRQTRLDEAAKDPDAERKSIADGFAGLNIKASGLEEYLGHPLDECTPSELVDLRGLYGALRDGEATWTTVMENKRRIAEQTAGAPKPPKTGADALKKGAKTQGAPSGSSSSNDGGKPEAGAQDESAARAEGAGASTATATGQPPRAADSRALDLQTAISDAIAEIEKLKSVDAVGMFVDDLDPSVAGDDQITKAVKTRLDQIKAKK